jgi:hypothetical protein
MCVDVLQLVMVSCRRGCGLPRKRFSHDGDERSSKTGGNHNRGSILAEPHGPFNTLNRWYPKKFGCFKIS